MLQAFRRPKLALWVCLFLVAFVSQLGLFESANAQAQTPAKYKVVSGDNLTFIAKRFGITLKDLRHSNNLKSDVLSIGQILNIRQPFQTSQPNPLNWQQPSEKTAEELRPFGNFKEKNILMTRTGADVSCSLGSAVHAPATAIVRHIGPQDGFGTVMILEHSNGYTTVFSPLDEKSIQVKVGDALNQGHFLGRTGKPVLENSRPYLHIELRLNKTAINPKALY